MIESTIQKLIMLTLCKLRNIRVFRNNCGMAYQGALVSENEGIIILKNARRIPFGLLDGSSDLIGWKSIIVTPDMVGKKLAIFVSIECKSETGTARPNQINWIETVNRNGGIAGIARSPEQALEICGGKP